jgi:DNA-binding response OmpR family regulator
MPPRATVLLVEDDAAIRSGVATCLELAGYAVLSAGDFAGGRRLALGAAGDLLLLDLALPGGDGLDILAAVRQELPARPVIVLTARGAEADRVRGLRLGADDYVVKPFGADELGARVEAVLRRAGVRAAPAGPRLRWPGGEADLAARVVRTAAGEAPLSAPEADLLRFLAERRERAVPREERIGLVWRTGAPGLAARAGDELVARLREKLGDDAAQAAVIATVRGCGYRLGSQVETA